MKNEMGWVVQERKKWRKKLIRPSLLTLNKLTPGVCCLLWNVNSDKNRSYLHHTSRPTQILPKGDLFGVLSRFVLNILYLVYRPKCLKYSVFGLLSRFVLNILYLRYCTACSNCLKVWSGKCTRVCGGFSVKLFFPWQENFKNCWIRSC